MSLSAISLMVSVIEVIIPVMVEEIVVGYVPLQLGMSLEDELVPVLLELLIQTVLPNLVVSKNYGSHKTQFVSALLRKNEEEIV